MDFIEGRAQRQLLLGRQVARAAAAMPANGVTTPYFTVAGGRVIITSFVGVVTTVFEANATTLKFSAVPTAGTATDMCGASASLSGKEVGGMFSIDGTAITTALQSTNAGNVGLMTKWIVVAAGTIDAVTATAENTGAASWKLTYIPLDDGAYVEAA